MNLVRLKRALDEPGPDAALAGVFAELRDAARPSPVVVVPARRRPPPPPRPWRRAAVLGAAGVLLAASLGALALLSESPDAAGAAGAHGTGRSLDFDPGDGPSLPVENVTTPAPTPAAPGPGGPPRVDLGDRLDVFLARAG